MPIPTRSVPGREPRKQPGNPGRTIPTLKPSTAASQSTEIPSKASPAKTTSSTLPTRRQSLIRPSQLKTPSSTKSTTVPTSTRTIARAPESPVKGPTPPVKHDGTVKQQIRPLSPKKTDMPPPARPVRSTSLRQPPSSNSGTPPALRGHARHRSQIVTPASKTPQVSSAATTSRTRNQFSTYQQHFSPKKTPKPPTPTPSANAQSDQSSSLIPSSWPEVGALQTELLQLSLLHKSGLERNDQRERDAESKLRRKYDSVAGNYRAILDVEKETQRQLNGQALHHWLKNAREHNGQQGFAEQIQLLSLIAQEVYDIDDSHSGRYTMAILEFESWLQRVEEVQEARMSRVGGQCADDFINPIHRDWKDETNALIMKLELASRQLQSLDISGYGDLEALDNSALLRVVKSLGALVHQMGEELGIIRKIEADIVKSETTWVSQLAQQLVEMQPRAVPAAPRTGLWTRSSFKS
ncbi:uncharacterized protein APUU_11835A [Aspergillus puulaauensis]|uniref:Uncharacterized protein n=1 Tax=Aspergillus puulaauensis TaxID=1220207 RepID=A0A7R7XCP4_9EURO|nr:uncharacterized protein APUU_11835A [Aspergillus puulaauensis]BCS19007.1 hypothetical protein APUU_11835A [Aspergillus puulaauensis]